MARSFPPDAEPALLTCSLAWVGAALGQSQLAPRQLVAHVQRLIDQFDFPRPLPSADGRGGMTTRATRRSVWMRAAVQTWLEGWLPPDAAAALDAAAMAAAAAEMDSAATNLRLIQGGRA